MGDREVVLAAVAQHGNALEYAAAELTGDREVVLAAVAQNSLALMHAAAELKGDRECSVAKSLQSGGGHSSEEATEPRAAAARGEPQLHGRAGEHNSTAK